MKQLPQYFVIKQDYKNPLWHKYINWLNRTYNQNWEGNVYNYYGFDGNNYDDGTSGKFNLYGFKNNPVELTLEEWNKCVNGRKLTLKDEFIIDTKNCYDRCTHIDGSDIIHNWDFVKWPFKNSQYWRIEESLPNLPIITYKEFLEMHKEKQIVGYKFKEGYTQYEKAALQICQPTDVSIIELFTNREGYEVNFTSDSVIKSKLEKARVLDLWFEPVFKEEETILKLGNPVKEIKVTKDYFKCEGNTINTSYIQSLYNYAFKNQYDQIHDWVVTFPSVKIGCSTFTKEEIELLLNTQKEL